MKNIVSFLSLLLLTSLVYNQTAPPHLKYFGYALVDVLWDDPHDTSTTTNYISEVDAFSNVAQLGVYSYTDTIISRVHLMNAHCVLPFLSIQSICFYEIDTQARSGHRFTLYTDYRARWNYFTSTNRAVLDSSKIVAFYVADEPVWNGITSSQLDSVCTMIKEDFPHIPILIVEAYPVLNSLVIPTTVDWVGFDRYAIFDPPASNEYMQDLHTLKAKRTTTDQKLFLIVDDQWLPLYGSAGYSPDTVRYMVTNYYNLAASDTSIIGMIGYAWAGGLDDHKQLGVRDMPQSVIDTNIAIGRRIKANFNPCMAVGMQESTSVTEKIHVHPNPSIQTISITLPTHQANRRVEIYNILGVKVKEVLVSNNVPIVISDLPDGMYVIRLIDKPGYQLRFVKQQ